jgi:hypothetical protein
MINWNKVNEKTPEFKKIVLGVKLPNEIELVRLDRIDENGPIFHKANAGFEFADIFTLRRTVDIDFWAEIDLPKESENNKQE